jgi:hypothetical protein
MIIGINGYSGTGKDTVGKLIQLAATDTIPEGYDVYDIVDNYPDHQWWLEEKSGWEIKKWAGKLKTIASLLTGISVEKFEDQEFKKTNLGPEWTIQEPYNSNAPWVADNEVLEVPMTVRDFLQKLGTDGLRTGLHENTWVNALMADYEGTYDLDTDRTTWPKWIITDTRFPNEAQAIKNAGGIVIRIDRPGVTAVNAHPSETALDNWKFDHKIMNGSDLTSLLFSVGNLLRKEDLI